MAASQTAGWADSQPDASARFAAGTEAPPCEIELSSPHGLLLGSSRLILRWRTTESGPFQARILDEDGQTVYTASTFGRELRVLVSQGPGAMGGPHPSLLEPGRPYRWRIEPPLVKDSSQCPVGEFRLLSLEESRQAEARFEAAGRKLGVGDEEREVEAGIGLAKLYLAESFYTDAERELTRLVDRGWDDPRIAALRAELYGKTGRNLSLAELSPPAPEGVAQ